MANRPTREPREHESLGQLRILWGLVRLGADRDGSGHFGVGWGLVRLGRDRNGSWWLSLLFGLIRMRTPPDGLTSSEPRVASPGRRRSSLADPYEHAATRAARRADAVRKAILLACLGLGVGTLVWQLGAVFIALAGGVLLANFSERFLPDWREPEVRQARLEVEARRDLAGEHARELQNLSASIAHEIRNPITAAKSLVQQMGEEPSSRENVEYARVALDELDRVERSVSHLLRFAREEQVTSEEFELAEVIQSALAVLKDRTEQGAVEIHTEIDSAGRMAGDRDKLRQVILNLVGNALDALGESGVPRPSVTIELGDNLAGTEVWLRVRDNGPGIDPEDQERIFDPFQTGRENGTGLGLAITRKLVEAHGGTIELESEPGHGTDFLLTFPKALAVA